MRYCQRYRNRIETSAFCESMEVYGGDTRIVDFVGHAVLTS